MASGAIEQAYWDARTPHDYRKMLARHQPLWEFVHEFIVAEKIDSVLEVGCGMLPPARAWVPHYQGIDLGKGTEAVHADFTTMDVTFWRGVDLLLACAVIEHCGPGYEPFLLKVRELRPRWSLISFFNGLQWSQNSCRQDDRGFWQNVYSGAALTDWLRANGFSHTLHYLGERDTVLILKGE